MPKNGVTIPKSESTRLKLLDCAVGEILAVGPDQIGFTSIARRAGMSTGALYARYENVDELLLEVWIHRGLPALRRLVAEMQESLDTTTGKPARQRLADMLRGPDPELCLIAKILVIARRNEAVGEFVIPTTVDVIEKALALTPAFDVYLSQVMGIALGVQGTGFVGMDWYGPISIVASSVRDATEPVALDASVPSIPEAVMSNEGLDDVDSRLFGAVSRVISRVGIDHATISRIARHADINPASMYMRYDDKNALLASCLSHVMSATYAQNKSLIKYFDSVDEDQTLENQAMSAVVMFRGNQSPEHREIRLLRLETMFGAAHHKELQDIMSRVLHEILSNDQEILGVENNGALVDAMLPVLVFSRFAFYGLALIGEFGFVQPAHLYVLAYTSQINRRISSVTSQMPK